MPESPCDAPIEELRSAGLAPTAASAVFGSPGEAAVGAQHDVVVELGLLDAMAMGGVTPGAARLQEPLWTGGALSPARESVEAGEALSARAGGAES